MNFISRALILLFGLIGNLIVLVVFSTKALEKFPPRNIYRILVILDSFTLTYGITNDFLVWSEESELLCRLDLYLRVAFSAPYLLVFISIEKFITIRYPHTKTIKNQKFQMIIILIIIACNLIVYHPIFYLNSFKKQINNTDRHYEIECNGEEFQKIFGTLDLIYYGVVPFVLMLIFSILLISTIVQSRLRILRLTNQRDRNRLKKDIQFAISSIFMNLSYLLIYLPAGIYPFILNELSTDLYYNVFVSLVYINYCDHFYILFCFNSVFRYRVLILFGLKPSLYQAGIIQTNNK
jgi:hypothetical protein